jgi:hypothetical protein
MAGMLLLLQMNQNIILTVINSSIYCTVIWLHTLFENHMQLKSQVFFQREKNMECFECIASFFYFLNCFLNIKNLL